MNSTQYPLFPGAKVGGTSLAAAVSMAPLASTLRGKCLRELRARGPMTADEVAAALGETVLAIRPRITELNKLHRIFDTGQRRKNRSGRNAIVWKVFP